MIWTWKVLGLHNFVQAAYEPIMVRPMHEKTNVFQLPHCHMSLLCKNFTGEWKSLHVVSITRESMKLSILVFLDCPLYFYCSQFTAQTVIKILC